ncbi:MAG: type I DNA topoisomerase [Christensenellales bacterium]
MKLVLIESSGKQETVSKYLGSGYKVIATKGHVRDLPVKSLGVDVEHNFKPEYQIMPEKKALIAKLKSESKQAEQVLFATDPDREGEAIAWHLATTLDMDPNNNSRIVFNEISKKAIQNALTKPRAIDINLVDAQQARRVLDRLVGYKLSPLVSNKIQNKLSAGRVQSVTLRLVVDRDREIENFVPEEYWTLTGLFKDEKIEGSDSFKATLTLKKNEKIKSKEQMDAVINNLNGKEYVVTNVKRAESKSHPSAPFTTSTMQQDALSKLGFSLKQTSALAQNLYEGVTIPGEGKIALITYIRTDSVRVSAEAQAQALDFIKNKFGQDYVPKTPNIYKSKKNIQDAHEAIRPITLERKPEDLKGVIDSSLYKLYKLIYDRFLASQMAEAVYNTINVDIFADQYQFKATGKTPVFDGFTILYNNSVESADEQSAKIPNVQENDKLTVLELKPEQKYTKPPARYTEASLVKAMEDKGIGRPATYSPTVNNIIGRNYLEKDGKNLISTELGRSVVDLLVKNFSDIMDVGFTANMEDKLDTIEEGGQVWQDVIKDFYIGFEKELQVALKDKTKVQLKVEVSEEVCPNCGANLVYKMGRFGKFLACPNFPDCKFTKHITDVVGTCPKCGGELLRKKSKHGKVFYGCNNFPKCDFASWDLPYKDKCPKCSALMVVKQFGNYNHVKCTKCDYSTKISTKEDKKEDNE